jgi:hypothetical protein
MRSNPETDRSRRVRGEGVHEAALAAPLGLTGAQIHLPAVRVPVAADLTHADLRRATLPGSDRPSPMATQPRRRRAAHR